MNKVFHFSISSISCVLLLSLCMAPLHACGMGSGLDSGFGLLVMAAIGILGITTLSTIISGSVWIHHACKKKRCTGPAVMTAISSIFPLFIASLWIWANYAH